MKILTSSDIKILEKSALEDSTGSRLMEKAGWQAFQYFRKEISDFSETRFWVCCGPGNNGGDGLVLARYLAEQGAQVRVLGFSKDAEFKTDEAKEQAKKLQEAGLEVEWVSSLEVFGFVDSEGHPDWIIDSVFGIGLNQPLEGIFLSYVDWVNDLRKKHRIRVLSMDIPSGLDPDSGKELERAVTADVTVSFEFYKRGFYLADGLAKVGKIICVPVGIRWNSELVKDKVFESNEFDFLPKFPELSQDTHKKKRGHALLIAGSKNKSGASVLSSLACARAGAGLVTLAVPKSAHAIVKSQLVDIMTEEVPSLETSVFSPGAIKHIEKGLIHKSAVLLGPGLAPDPNRKEFIEALLKKIHGPLVIDAQALTDLGERIGEIDFSGSSVVITPHPGEMSKLTGLSTREIQDRRFDIVEKYAKQWGLSIVLKGRYSMVGLPSGEIWVNQVDHPCLSVAGTGDVLSGILLSLLAQGLSVKDASCLAVYIHGRCGEKLGEYGVRGVLASDLLEKIPQVIYEIDSN